MSECPHRDLEKVLGLLTRDISLSIQSPYPGDEARYQAGSDHWMLHFRSARYPAWHPIATGPTLESAAAAALDVLAEANIHGETVLGQSRHL